jgi:hypothetical protein
VIGSSAADFAFTADTHQIRCRYRLYLARANGRGTGASVSHESAVDRELCASDEGSFAAGEEYVDRCDFVWSTCPAHRSSHDVGLLITLDVEDVLDRRCRNDIGVH